MRFTFCPVVKLWFSNVITFAPVWTPTGGKDVVMPVPSHETGSIIKLSFKGSLFTITSDNVPIPVDVFVITFKSMKSSSFSWWNLDSKVTIFLLFLTFTFSWTNTLSNEYVSLLATALPLIDECKNTSSPPIVFLIPITFLFFLTAKTVDGMAEIVPAAVSDTPIGFPSFVTFNFWFVTNGWFSKYIPFAGIVLVILVSPNVNSISLDLPAVAAAPTNATDFIGL